MANLLGELMIRPQVWGTTPDKPTCRFDEPWSFTRGYMKTNRSQNTTSCTFEPRAISCRIISSTRHPPEEMSFSLRNDENPLNFGVPVFFGLPTRPGKKNASGRQGALDTTTSTSDTSSAQGGAWWVQLNGCGCGCGCVKLRDLDLKRDRTLKQPNPK
jgi:hypothetical protein